MYTKTQRAAKDERQVQNINMYTKKGKNIMTDIKKINGQELENEVIHNGPKNGQLVQITGNTVKGTGINGVPATYVWVYSPDFGVSGYVNAYFIG